MSDNNNDVKLYDEFAEKCRNYFVDKREKYGSHLEYDKEYFSHRIYAKSEYFQKEIKKGNVKNLDKQSCIDMINYLIMYNTVE